MSRHLLLSGNCCWDFWNYRRGLLRGLIAAGYRLTVVAPPDETADWLAGMGVEVLSLPFARGGKNPLADAWLCLRYRRLFRRQRPDLIIHYGIKPCIFGGLAARFAGIRSLMVITGLGSGLIHGGMLASLVQALYRLALSSAVKVLFLNAADRAYFLERRLVPSPAVDLLPGEGIDVEHYAFAARKAARGARVFLFVGRLLHDKGVVEFVQAARRLKLAYPECRCQLLGGLDDSNPSSVTAAELAAWVAAGDVEHLGKVDDVRQPIAEADCVVLPSYREGLPRALLEAAAIGRMQIASRVAGCMEVVAEGETGWLCRAADADDLADTMIKVAAMEDEDVSRMGLSARQRVCRLFSDRVVVERYQALLSSL